MVRPVSATKYRKGMFRGPMPEPPQNEPTKRRRRASRPRYQPLPGERFITAEEASRRFRIHIPPRDDGTIEYAFPLRPGVVVTMRLPVDFTAREARRMGAWLASLPLDEDENRKPEE